MMGAIRTVVAVFVLLGMLGGCAAHNPKMWETAKLPKATPATNKLNALPPTEQKVAIAVYGFTDQTGQFKPSDTGQTLSRAVTQGATSILVKSLHEAGNRTWFTVIEREKLDNVLRERAVIREMRASYLGEKQINPQALPPLLFAGVLLEGGIIGFDSNTKTGGSGARLLGIGGRTQYREDTVTIYLRAVSVKTGEVLMSVSTRKSIASVGIGADAFRFVAFRELLELEAGITYNEPDELALRQAIEAAVYALVMEGAMQDLWCFSASDAEVRPLLTDYISERDSIRKSRVVLPAAANGAPVAGMCGVKNVARSVGQQPQQIAQARRQKAAATPAVTAQGAPAAKQANSVATAALSKPAQPVAAPPQQAVRETKPAKTPVNQMPAAQSDARPVPTTAPAVTSSAVPLPAVPNKLADDHGVELASEAVRPEVNGKSVQLATANEQIPLRIVSETMISYGELPAGYTPSVPEFPTLQNATEESEATASDETTTFGDFGWGNPADTQKYDIQPVSVAESTEEPGGISADIAWNANIVIARLLQ